MDANLEATPTAEPLYTYKKQNQLQSLSWVVSMTSVHLRDVAERCYGPFMYYRGIGIRADLYSSWSWNTINSSDVRVSRSMPVFFYRGHISMLLQCICTKLSTEIL